MSKQILALHQTSEREFDLTAIRTGSVRDQLLRSSMLAHSLCDVQFVNSGRALLIIGAGPAGVCAAMCAASRGVNVTIVERRNVPLASLAAATWRRVDADEYDWPHSHRVPGFPKIKGWYPLQLTSGTGAQLSSRWYVVWQAWCAARSGVGGCGRIDFVAGTEGQDIIDHMVLAPSKRSLRIVARWKAGNRSKRSFGALIRAFGFDRERTSNDAVMPDPWNGYWGAGFWNDFDGLLEGRKSTLPCGRILISGGGDGAMQDFQRAATGSFGKPLLDQIVKALQNTKLYPNSSAVEDLLHHIKVSLFDADYKTMRMRAWERGGQPAVAVLKECNEVFWRASNVFLKPLWRSKQDRSVDYNAVMESLFDTVFRDGVLDGQLEIFWIYRGSGPDHGYALNRFLCVVLRHLVATMQELLDEQGGSGAKVKFFSNTSIAMIQPVGHQCGDPLKCLGEKHIVQLTGDSNLIIDADNVIVRHGMIRNEGLGPKPPVTEQLTPFDVPS